MEYMFNACYSLKSLELSSFDTSNVTDMSNMFGLCESLATLDLSNFNTSNLSDKASLFSSCYLLTSVDFTNVVFLNISEYEYMFKDSNINMQIIVKDETQRTWLTSKFPELTNVVLPSEL